MEIVTSVMPPKFPPNHYKTIPELENAHGFGFIGRLKALKTVRVIAKYLPATMITPGLSIAQGLPDFCTEEWKVAKLGMVACSTVMIRVSVSHL